MKAAVIAGGILLAGTCAADARTLRIGTWNIANLHHEIGVPLRDGAESRDQEDFDRLRAFADLLNLDIAALQEIGSPAALDRIFPSADYHIVMSANYRPGDENRPASEREIFTAFAIKKSSFPSAPPIESIPAFNIVHVGYDTRTNAATARPTRDGMALDLQIGGRPVKLLNLHLKSFCHTASLSPVFDTNQSGRVNSNRYDCRTLVAQIMVLENWTEQQIQAGRSVMIVGDLNRQINRFHDSGRKDHFWMMLNDGGPPGVDLRKGPVGKNTVCWPRPHTQFHAEHIEFVLFDSGLDPWLKESAIKKVGLPHQDDPKYADRAFQKLSDHCPIVFEVTD